MEHNHFLTNATRPLKNQSFHLLYTRQIDDRKEAIADKVFNFTSNHVSQTQMPTLTLTLSATDNEGNDYYDMGYSKVDAAYCCQFIEDRNTEAVIH